MMLSVCFWLAPGELPTLDYLNLAAIGLVENGDATLQHLVYEFPGEKLKSLVRSATGGFAKSEILIYVSE